MTLRRPKPFTVLVVFHALVLGAALAVLSRHAPVQRYGKDTIAVIPIDGVITMGRAGGFAHGGSVDDLVAGIDALTERKDVKAIVLKINSPGGSVGAVQAVYEALQRFRRDGRPVVSTFGDIAASGGYYVACGGDRIVAHPGTLTGSIGVVMEMPNVTGLMQKVGLSMNTITSGAMKDSGSPFRAMTAGERAYFKSLIDDAYGQFFAAVKSGRHLSDDALKPLADGRVFSGQMAMKVKLVDQLGGTKEAIDLATELAGLKGKKPRVVEQKEKPSLDRLLSLFSRSAVSDLAAMTQTGPLLLYEVP